MKFRIKGEVLIQCFAYVEAKSLKEVQKMVKEAGGSGIPDDYNYEDGDWIGPVENIIIEEIEK
jgi:hypothetical protein